MTNGMLTTSTAWIRSDAIMIFLRLYRSTKTPASSPTTRLGIAVTISVRPTASADPVSRKTKMPAARSVSDEPTVETSWAIQSSGSRGCGRPRTSTGRAQSVRPPGLFVGHGRTPSDMVQRAMGALLHTPSAPLARRSVPAGLARRETVVSATRQGDIDALAEQQLALQPEVLLARSEPPAAVSAIPTQ